jgi:stage III sporulation protein AA
MGLRRVDTLCVRFSHALRSIGHTLLGDIRSVFPQGTLVYAPPGGGKTTLLRALATHLAGGERPLRVALIDTRGELDDGFFDKALSLSVLSHYPKGQGIEIATRTQDAQLIVCDEIGAEEARAVLSVANSGVPILASAHAAGVEELLRRPPLRALCEAAVFGLFVGIERRPSGGESRYQLTEWAKMGAALCG